MWVQRSFDFVKKGGYLDKLVEIYPPPPSPPRPIAKQTYQQLEEIFNRTDEELLEFVLTLGKFPFNDPYVSYLRKSPEEIASNPITVKRLCARLREMGVNGVVKGLEEPKQFNRQMGAMFARWLRQKYPCTSDIDEFNASRERVILLGLSGENLRQVANEKGCGLQKQPDFVAKIRKRYVVGETKFIGTEGGNQNRAFDDALKLASVSAKHAVPVAVLDGIIWIPNSGQMSRRLSNFSGNALSALLLDEFFSSF